MVDVPHSSTPEKELFLKSLPSHFSFRLQVTDIQTAIERLSFLLASVPAKYAAPLYNMFGYIASIEDNLTDSLQYFDIASSMDKDDLVGVANTIHVLRSSNQQDKADLILESVMSKLKALPKYIEKIKIGRSIADIAWAHSFLGLNCVADRLFQTSLEYDSKHVFTQFGAALVHYNFSKHIDRMTECFYMNTSTERLHSIVQKSPKFNLPKLYLARILNKRDQAQRNGMDPQARKLLEDVLNSSDAYTDYMVAKEKSKYDDWDGTNGSINLLSRSIRKHPTSLAYMHLALTKKRRLLKGNNINESQEMDKKITLFGEEKKEPVELRKSDSSRSERAKEKTPPKPPTPPPPDLITDDLLRELEEINRYFELALSLNPSLQRCCLELANTSILQNCKEAAYRYLQQAAEESPDLSVRARAYRNLSYCMMSEGDLTLSNSHMENAFKYGISTLCRMEEKAKLRTFLGTLVDQLLNGGFISEAKPWVEQLIVLEHPEALDIKARYKALRGSSGKAGGIKVSTAISRTRAPKRTTQITKTTISTGEGSKKGVPVT